MYDITLYVIMSVVDHVAERAAYKYGPSWSMRPSCVEARVRQHRARASCGSHVLVKVRLNINMAWT